MYPLATKRSENEPPNFHVLRRVEYC